MIYFVIIKSTNGRESQFVWVVNKSYCFLISCTQFLQGKFYYHSQIRIMIKTYASKIAMAITLFTSKLYRTNISGKFSIWMINPNQDWFLSHFVCRLWWPDKMMGRLEEPNPEMKCIEQCLMLFSKAKDQNGLEIQEHHIKK